MTTITKLNELSKMFKKKNLLKGGGNNSISNIQSVETRITLDDLLKNIMDNETSDCNNSSENTEKNSNQNNNVNNTANNAISKRYTEIVNKETTQLSKLSVNIVNIIRYLSSPLRLYMKVSCEINREQVIASLHQIKLNDIVKNEIISGWTDADTYGLYVLSKVFKNKASLDLLMRDQETYTKFFSEDTQFDVNAPQCYLFRVVFSGAVRLQKIHEKINEYFTNLLDKDDEEVNQVLEMFRSEISTDLQRKLAKELNNFALVVTQKRIKIKDLYNAEQCYYPQDLYFKIRELLATTHFNNLLLEWENSDNNVGKMGGKKRVKKNKKKLKLFR